ncbi:MAG: transcriptional regulator [Chitinophagales bacterium]|nr:transcriptional regulator [Chitinophagales bacterium]
MFICKSNYLGDHIRTRRKYLGLFQKDVAEIIGVSEDCITYWENRRSMPQINHYPAIIKFLGYSPSDYTEHELPQRILKYRTEYGLSHKKLGKIIGVDASTISSWERGIHKPNNDKLRLLESIIHSSTSYLN